MSTQPQQRQYPTLTLGTVYLIDSEAVVDELVHLCEHIDGDLRNYTDRSGDFGDNIRIELTDAYPSRLVTMDGESYLPPIDDWETARITVTPSSTTDPIPQDLTLTFLISRSDLAHTLQRFDVVKEQSTRLGEGCSV